MSKEPLYRAPIHTVKSKGVKRVSLPRISEGCKTKFAPRKPQKLIASGNLTSDEKVSI